MVVAAVVAVAPVAMALVGSCCGSRCCCRFCGCGCCGCDCGAVPLSLCRGTSACILLATCRDRFQATGAAYSTNANARKIDGKNTHPNITLQMEKRVIPFHRFGVGSPACSTEGSGCPRNPEPLGLGFVNLLPGREVNPGSLVMSNQEGASEWEASECHIGDQKQHTKGTREDLTGSFRTTLSPPSRCLE